MDLLKNIEEGVTRQEKKGRSKRRFMDVVTDGMQEVGMEEEVAKVKINWKTMIFCCDS